MLSFLAKYRRMELNHPVLGEKHLLELIISFLETEDLLVVTHVCFLWRELVFTDPYREITIVRFSLRQTSSKLEVTPSQAYTKRFGQIQPAASSRRSPFFQSSLIYPNKDYGLTYRLTLKPNSRRKPAQPVQSNPVPPKQSEEHKKEDLIESFRRYAKSEGFHMRRRAEFTSDEHYLMYQLSFQECYNRFKVFRACPPHPSPIPDPPSHADTYASQQSFPLIKAAWEKVQEGAKLLWEEIKEEESYPYPALDWKLPKPKAIKDHIINTFPGLAILHYYYKNKKKE